MPDYWLRQTADKPLFPELLWSRPEHRTAAGKLLIVGGHQHAFAAPAEAYSDAVKSGVGTAHVLLPDALQKSVGRWLENGEFAPSTPSGSFSQRALDTLLTHAAWADGVLIAGDLGRNSETAILLEAFLTKHQGLVCLTKDAIDYVTSAPHSVLRRPDTVLVLSLSQLQRLAVAARATKPVTLGMGLLHLAEWLHEFSTTHAPTIVVKHLDHILVASDGRISSTQLSVDEPIWRVKTAAAVSVWQLQNPDKQFEALTTAIYDIFADNQKM